MFKWFQNDQMMDKLLGFIKSTDHRPNDHRLLTQPTTFYLKYLTMERYRFCRIQTQLGKLKTVLRSVIYLVKIICLYKFERLQRKSTFLLVRYGVVTYV